MISLFGMLRALVLSWRGYLPGFKWHMLKEGTIYNQSPSCKPRNADSSVSYLRHYGHSRTTCFWPQTSAQVVTPIRRGPWNVAEGMHQLPHRVVARAMGVQFWCTCPCLLTIYFV